MRKMRRRNNNNNNNDRLLIVCGVQFESNQTVNGIKVKHHLQIVRLPAFVTCQAAVNCRSIYRNKLVGRWSDATSIDIRTPEAGRRIDTLFICVTNAVCIIENTDSD